MQEAATLSKPAKAKKPPASAFAEPPPAPAVPIIVAMGRIDVVRSKLTANYGVAELKPMSGAKFTVKLPQKLAPTAVIQVSTDHNLNNNAHATVVSRDTDGFVVTGAYMFGTGGQGFMNFVVYDVSRTTETKPDA